MQEINCEQPSLKLRVRGDAIWAMLLVVQLLGFGYVALSVYVWSTFPINDHLVMSMGDADWRRMGVEQLVRGGLVALACGAISFAISRLFLGGTRLRRSLLTAAAMTLLVFSAACVGAIEFMRERDRGCSSKPATMKRIALRTKLSPKVRQLSYC